MEFLLPVALKFFPNMLPSTFEDKHAADEKKRKLLKVRLEMAKFLQETIKESGITTNNPEKLKNSEEFKAFFRKVRSTGEQPSTDDIVKVARLFEDDLTLDNLSRPQLVSMCRYMNINAFGTDNFLRYTIRSRLAKLSQDDKVRRHNSHSESAASLSSRSDMFTMYSSLIPKVSMLYRPLRLRTPASLAVSELRLQRPSGRRPIYHNGSTSTYTTTSLASFSS